MRFLARIGISFFTIAVAVSAASCAVESAGDDRRAMLASQYVEGSGVSGLAVSVALGNEIVWTQGFGFAKDLVSRISNKWSPSIRRRPSFVLEVRRSQ